MKFVLYKTTAYYNESSLTLCRLFRKNSSLPVLARLDTSFASHWLASGRGRCLSRSCRSSGFGGRGLGGGFCFSFSSFNIDRLVKWHWPSFDARLPECIDELGETYKGE